jgi:hypothetical protein
MSYSDVYQSVPSREGTSARQEGNSSSSSAGGSVSLFPRLALQTKFGNKPRATGPQINPNDILYPQVLAGERLFFWTSAPAMERRLMLVQSTPPNLLIKYDNAIAAQWSTETKIGYGSGIKKWISFCDKYDVPPDSRLPASRQWLLLFMSSQRGDIGSSNFSTIMSGIRAWHVAQDVPWHGDPKIDDLVKGFRHAVAVAAPASTTRAPRPPVTVQHLITLRNGLDVCNDSRDAAVYAVACCAFWGVARLGELTVKSLKEKQEDQDKRVKRSPLPTFVVDERGVTCGADFHVPWTKMTKHVGATIVLSPITDSDALSTNPVEALLNHLHLNSTIPDTAHLFAYRDGTSSQVLPMLKRVFTARCKQVWKDAGCADVSGHSFRIGGCTELLLRGVSHEWVKIAGRWKSDAWQVYIRGTPVLLQNEMRRVSAALSREHLVPPASSVPPELSPPSVSDPMSSFFSSPLFSIGL